MPADFTFAASRTTVINFTTPLDAQGLSQGLLIPTTVLSYSTAKIREQHRKPRESKVTSQK